ncbi:MAG: hypothetical protein C0444_00625 [Microbacterium sp.]|nr:hypothetical protein [Microbacterium sp.]MBA4346891.1 hypothetical protein [Microbacterium sp.]
MRAPPLIGVDVTPFRRRALSVLLAAAVAVATITAAGPAVAQTDAQPAPLSSSESRTPDASTEQLTAAAAGVVSGRLLFSTNAVPAGTPVVNGEVTAYRENPLGDFVPQDATDVFDADGDWSISGLPAGTYKFSFLQDGESFNSRVWFNGMRTADFATHVTLSEGVAQNFGTVVIPRRTIGIQRVAGVDRFATSVALSQTQFPNGSFVPVVIVNGLDYPDALSAGPLANALGGVMLMVTPTSIPAATAAEMTRLEPSVIVIVGGTGVVSAAVATQLESYTSSSVIRVAGEDRYATSRAVVEFAFDGVAPSEILLATGRNFPDALAAGAAAGARGGAVLLVNGQAAALDSASSALIDGYGSGVYIIGGTGSVSSGIQQSVVSLGQFNARLAGADRYATSVEVAINLFGYADVAYLVNGSGFADALAAGPIAGMRGAPIYLTTPTCVTTSVWTDLDLVLANQVITVGGTGVMSDAVYNLQGCNGQRLPGFDLSTSVAPVASTD